MIEDGKPAHWPKMLAAPDLPPEQGAVRALAEVRRLVVDHYDIDDDWRRRHAQTAYIVNVIAGLIADAKATDAFMEAQQKTLDPLRDKIKDLTEQLAESKRPFTAQMEMQNRRIIALTAEVDRLTLELANR